MMYVLEIVSVGCQSMLTFFFMVQELKFFVMGELEEDGRYATLLEPYKGYRRIKLIRQTGYKWLVRIIDSGLELEVYDDEFILDDE